MMKKISKAIKDCQNCEDLSCEDRGICVCPYPEVTPKGGNQYLVTIGNRAELVDLDGYTIIRDEDFDKLEKAGLLEDTMWCPKLAQELEKSDKFFCAAIDHCANYSGFNVDDYIADRLQS
jgi:hypothetical protein